MISIYADGSSDGTSNGAIGWGWVIVDDGLVVSGGYGGDKIGTNNIAELSGAIHGLEDALKRGLVGTVELVSDSMYVLNLANKSYSATKNLELVQKLQDLTEKIGARTRWVRGHSGDVCNEKCDQLAKYGKSKYMEPKVEKKKINHKKIKKEERKALVKEQGGRPSLLKSESTMMEGATKAFPVVGDVFVFYLPNDDTHVAGKVLSIWPYATDTHCTFQTVRGTYWLTVVEKSTLDVTKIA